MLPKLMCRTTPSKELLEQTTAVQKQQIAEMKPKASYYDVVLNCKDLISTSTVLSGTLI